MQKKLLNAIVAEIAKKKPDFIEGLKGKISSQVSSKSSVHCLTLVTFSSPRKSSESPREWSPQKDGLDYAERLIAFLQKKDHVEKRYYVDSDGRRHSFDLVSTVDSVLTDEVVNLITKEFSLFYKENQELIAQGIIAAIVTDKKLSNSFFSTLITKNKATRYASSRVQGLLKDVLIGGFQTKLDGFNSAIFDSISHATQATLASPVVAAVIHKAATYSMTKVLLVKITSYVAAHMSVIVAKVMAVPAIKAVISKFVVAAVLGVSLKAIAAKASAMGISVSVATLTAAILVPIFVGLVIKEWNDLPKNMGKGIADEVGKSLGSSFNETNYKILEGLFEDFLGDQADSIANAIVDDKEITEALKSLKDLIHA